MLRESGRSADQVIQLERRSDLAAVKTLLAHAPETRTYLTISPETLAKLAPGGRSGFRKSRT